MRLIDADKLETTAVLGVQLQHADSRYYYFYEEETIEKAPTVQAIPIEWFEWLLDTMGDGMYNLRAVIKDWERYKENWGKENENRVE